MVYRPTEQNSSKRNGSSNISTQRACLGKFSSSVVVCYAFIGWFVGGGVSLVTRRWTVNFLDDDEPWTSLVLPRFLTSQIRARPYAKTVSTHGLGRVRDIRTRGSTIEEVNVGKRILMMTAWTLKKRTLVFRACLPLLLRLRMPIQR